MRGFVVQAVVPQDQRGRDFLVLSMGRRQRVVVKGSQAPGFPLSEENVAKKSSST